MHAATAAHRPLRPHTLVATLSSTDLAALTNALQRLPADVGLAEIRLDALWPAVPDAEQATDQLLTLADAATVPLLATLRPKRQGGRFDGPENIRIGLLQAALQAGFAHADVELDVLATGGVAQALAQHGGLVASQHEFGEVPCRSDGLKLLQSMQDFQVGYDKLALTVGAFNDQLRALEFVRAHAERGGRPAIATMGHGGAALRALLPFAGNRATYASAPGLPPAAPGQPTLADVQAVWSQWGIGAADLDHLAERPRPWLAVLGTPVAHSRSPALHNAALRQAGRPERYAALDVPASASALRLAFHVAPRVGMVGASVTAPHKVDAARAAKGDASVQATGAANCIRFAPDGAASATNTDASAMQTLLRGRIAAGEAALVLGSGGAARAALHALHQLGADTVVASRDPTRGQAAAALGARWVAWDQRDTVRPRVVVQASSVGSHPEDLSPLAAASLAHKPAVVELVYAAGPTRLERAAKAAGCDVVDGITVLVQQAADAYRFWFGETPDVRAMDAAARRQA